MKYYGTKNDKDYGFYLESFEGAVEVEDEVWKDLLGQCATGKVIRPDENGYPIVVEYVPPVEEMEKRARAKRNHLLVESDWTQLQDAALTEQKREEWKAYRQALRDITDQPGFPQEIAWPNKPE